MQQSYVVNRKTIVVVAVLSIVVVGAVFLLFRNSLEGSISPANNDELLTDTASVTSSKPPPPMVLTILQGNEDNSKALEQYRDNNSESITLRVDQHIRFESPDYRIPDSLKVIAVGQSGGIHTLLKSYDVNNEFFTKLDKGSYQFRVQATWFEIGTEVYLFNVTIT